MNQISIISSIELRQILSEEIKNALSKFEPNVNPTNKDELITRDETAEILKISLPTLNNYTKDGKLQSYNIGSRVLYKKSEVIDSLIKLTARK
jgi:excisionase family DNA binding protein